MNSTNREVLALCYGNPGRLDDGLGPALGALLEREGGEGLTVEKDYQLTVEDSTLIAGHRLVLFVDASKEALEPFSVERVPAGAPARFSTHSLHPENLLTLTEEIFGSKVTAYAIGIRGYAFGGFGELLTDRARENMHATLEFLLDRSRPLTLASLQPRLEREASRQSELRRLLCEKASL